MPPKPPLWLLLAERSCPEIAAVIPTVAWMAADAGAAFEIYLESHRTGKLFAEHGSTVLGGHHHHQFNYLCASFDVRIIRYGATGVFDSSVRAFGLPVLADADSPGVLYRDLLAQPGVNAPSGVLFIPAAPLRGTIDLAPYLFPEILYRRALGASAQSAAALASLAPDRAETAFLDEADHRLVVQSFPAATVADRLGEDDTWATLTRRIAQRWKAPAKEVVFGDPPAILAQLATHCRHRRVALYAPVEKPAPADVVASWYTESVSPLAAEAAALAVELGSRVITGRQTGDGDIFEWSKQGVCIQIIDPNRPAFPVVDQVRHPWAAPSAPPLESSEPTDDQLLAWAQEGKVLTTLNFHSGEVAHNEAMLALVELAGWANVKFGVGVHAQRYETCPQMWELLSIPPDQGGARGLVEPLLHAGGLGVMAECHCPPALLRENCEQALARIRAIAGEANLPRGYYAFMDSNHDRLDEVRADLFDAIAATGLEFIVSSARPGRNRVLWRSADGRCRALNQTPRVVEGTSPFVRATTPEDLANTMGANGPGWIIATLDAPVISFAPYIWKKGRRFMDVLRGLTSRGNRINVLPSTIARYARLLEQHGSLPRPLA